MKFSTLKGEPSCKNEYLKMQNRIFKMTSFENTENRTNRYYYDLFSLNHGWSTSYPNRDEAARWMKIGKFLSDLVADRKISSNRRLRILDIGCGRGWLTHLASIYGDTEGVDPVPESIQKARNMYPHLKFFSGTAKNVYEYSNKKPYDVVIATEVLEHVIDKVSFVEDIKRCLCSDGYIIITTPRGELFDKWIRMGYPKQPIDQWITEREVLKLFRALNFVSIYHDRIYIDLASMSLLHRICASRKIKRLLSRFGIIWFQKYLEYIASIYQIWCFQYKTDH